MVTVKLFGVFRLDSGVKQLEAEAKTVKDIYPIVIDEIKKVRPDSTLTEKKLKGSVIIVNGTPGKTSTKLNDGDIVNLMPPVAGG